MTKETYKKISIEDRKLFNDSLNIVTGFMTDADENKKEYKKKLIESVDKYIRDNPDELSPLQKERLKKAAGLCENKTYKSSLLHRKFKVFPLGKKKKCEIAIKKVVTRTAFEYLATSVHELNHADTIQYGTSRIVVYFNGFVRDVNTSMHSVRTYGVGLNEVINEMYTQIQLFTKYPEVFTNIRGIDDLVFSPVLPEYTVGPMKIGGAYKELGLVAKLLLIAADNNLYDLYEDHKDDIDKFIEKKVTLCNGKQLIKNDLLYAGKKNAKEFGENFDTLCDKFGSFVKLLEKFDALLNQLKRSEPMNPKIIEEIIRVVRVYKEAKHNKLVEQGYWNEQIRQNNDYVFDKYEELLCLQYGLDRNSIPYTLEDNKKQMN